jgi:hypothetical protein
MSDGRRDSARQRRDPVATVTRRVATLTRPVATVTRRVATLTRPVATSNPTKRCT